LTRGDWVENPVPNGPYQRFYHKTPIRNTDMAVGLPFAVDRAQSGRGAV